MKNPCAWLSVLATAAVVAACADTVRATPDEISIVQGFSLIEADPAHRVAQEHCATFGKDALLVIRTGRVVRYACVPAP